MANPTKSKDNYNTTIVGLYKTKQGYWSMPLDSRNYDTVAKVVHEGGKFAFKETTEEAQAAYFAKTGKKLAPAFLEFIPKEKVEAQDNFYKQKAEETI